MSDVLDRSPFSSTRHALSHVVIALGVHVLGSERQLHTASSSAYDSIVHFNTALRLKPQILGEDFSVRNFQVSLMIQASIRYPSLKLMEGTRYNGICVLIA